MNCNCDIHGLVRISSDIKLPLPEYFRVDDTDPDIRFPEDDLDFEKPEECKTMRIGSYYWLEGSRLRFEYPGGAKFELDMGDMKVRLNSKFVKFSSEPTLESLVMRMLQMKLISEEHAMIHAGCVAFGDDCSLIIAPPDFGKTSTVLSLVAAGADFLGDDHVIINGEGTALCYSRELTISPHTITSGVARPVTFWKRALARLGPLYQMALRLLGSQHEHRRVPEEIMRGSASISHAFSLKGFASDHEVSPADSGNIAENMILPVPYMTGYPDSYADIYSYFLNLGLKEFIDKGMKISRDALEGAECYDVRGPEIGSWAEAIRKELSG